VITAAAPVLSMAQRHWVGRRAQQLAGVSVAYNLIEAVVAVAAGAVAGSIALIGFGLDSLVEMSSGLVILWQFRHPVPESRERFALRLIGLSFFALAAYVGVGSVRNLIGDSEPAPSAVGIALAGVAASDAGAVVGAAADRTDAQLRKCGR
jgi:divalent metal cation (Fe/Co/Zn/Cd) transporter